MVIAEARAQVLTVFVFRLKCGLLMQFQILIFLSVLGSLAYLQIVVLKPGWLLEF